MTKEERNMLVEQYLDEIKSLARYEFSRFNAPWSFDEEDLFQEAVCRLLKDLELWDESKSGIRTFIHSRSKYGIKDAVRIRTNTAKVALVTDSREVIEEKGSSDLLPSSSFLPYIIMKLDYEYLVSKFKFLSEKEREVMFSHYIEGESLTEHSEGEGFSLAWASLLRDKAILKLKKIIEVEENEKHFR